MKKSKKLLKQKINKFAKLLAISDYTIDAHLVNPKKAWKGDEYDSYAKVGIDEDTREACISINKKLFTKKPEELDRTLIHELLHVRFSELSTWITLILTAYVKDKKARKTYEKQFSQLEHKLIIPLTEALLNHGKCTS